MKNRNINPVTFFRGSLDFMQGYPRWKVLLYMPIAYVKTLFIR